ncbi:MAG: hypothetical protein AB1473_16675 [Thermodesulfobacteriota bacterium]
MSKRRLLLLTLIVLGVNSAFLLPVLDSPYLGDDSWRESLTKGLVLLSEKNLLEMCWEISKDFISSGRWYPLIIYYYPVFYYVDQHTYKVMTLLFVVGNVMLFGWFVSLISRSAKLGLMAMMLPPLTLQLRMYHDAILSYYFLMQIEFAFLMLSAIGLVYFLRRARWWLYIVSILSYLACLLVYEVSYAFWLVHAVLCYVHFGRHRLKQALLTSLPFVALSVLNLGIMLIIRATFGVYYEGVQSQFAPMQCLITFAKQVFSATPLSYFVSTPVIQDLSIRSEMFSLGLLIAICAPWGLVWYTLWRKRSASDSSGEPAAAGALSVLGIVIWLAPSIPIAFSAKYQRELQWGLGYLPTYLSAFGVDLLLLAGGVFVSSRLRGTARVPREMFAVCTAIIGAVVSAIAFNSNCIVVQKYAHAERFPRALMETALEHGLLRPVKDKSFLICGEPFHSWDNPPFFKQYSGMTLQVVKPKGFCHDEEMGSTTIDKALAKSAAANRPGCYDFTCPANCKQVFSGYDVVFKGLGWPVLCKTTNPSSKPEVPSVFFLRYEASSEAQGYAVLAKLRGIKVNSGEIVEISADRTWVYAAVPSASALRNLRIRCKFVDEQNRSTKSFEFDQRQLRAVRISGKEMILQLPPCSDGLFVDPRSIRPGIEVVKAANTAFQNRKNR